MSALLVYISCIAVLVLSRIRILCLLGIRICSMTKSQTTMWNNCIWLCVFVFVWEMFSKTFWYKQWYKGYCNWFLAVIFPVYTRQQGAAGNSNESVCLLPLAGAQHRRKVISKWMRGLKNWKLGDKLLFSWGAKQQHNFSADFCLCVNLSPFYISLFSIMSTCLCRLFSPSPIFFLIANFHLHCRSIMHVISHSLSLIQSHWPLLFKIMTISLFQWNSCAKWSRNNM